MDGLLKLAGQVVGTLREKRLFITTVESCTGGGVANCITNIKDASSVLTGAKVAYSCAEKVEFGVPEPLARRDTVYSGETAIAMARAGIAHAERADVGVGITGMIRTPEEGGDNVVHIAVVLGDCTACERYAFPATHQRWEAKEKIIQKALKMVLELLSAW